MATHSDYRFPAQAQTYVALVRAAVKFFIFAQRNRQTAIIAGSLDAHPDRSPTPMLVEVISGSVAAQLSPASAWKVTLCSKRTLTQRCYTPLADRAIDKTLVSTLLVAWKRAWVWLR